MPPGRAPGGAFFAVAAQGSQGLTLVERARRLKTQRVDRTRRYRIRRRGSGERRAGAGGRGRGCGRGHGPWRRSARKQVGRRCERSTARHAAPSLPRAQCSRHCARLAAYIQSGADKLWRSTAQQGPLAQFDGGVGLAWHCAACVGGFCQRPIRAQIPLPPTLVPSRLLAWKLHAASPPPRPTCLPRCHCPPASLTVCHFWPCVHTAARTTIAATVAPLPIVASPAARCCHACWRAAIVQATRDGTAPGIWTHALSDLAVGRWSSTRRGTRDH